MPPLATVCIDILAMFSWPSHMALVMCLTLLSPSLHRPGLGWGEQGMF